MIKLVNVSKYYSSNDVIALGLRKVNLEFHLNEFVAVVGESGSGKTTLLNVISGIDSYEEGEMYINGKETSYFSIEDMENYRKKYVAFVFQNYNLIDSYTVLQNVEAPLILSGYQKDKIKQRAMEIIKRVGLENHIHHKATKLSGGQKQRVVIARALAKDCPIIAADEPTGNLDSDSAIQIIKLLHEISKEKLVIVVTHDFAQVEEYATRKIRIYDGEIVEDRNITKVDKKDLPEIADKDYKIKFKEFLKLALRNLLAVPKKTLLMLVIFTFFSVFVAMAYGAYYITMSESSYSNNYHFSNTNPDRIVVKKSDNGPFTQSDLDELASYKKVQTVMPYDYVLDASEWVNYESDSRSILRAYSISYLPIELIQKKDLNYGTMPNAADEVVMAINSDDMQDAANFLLGQRFSSMKNYDDVKTPGTTEGTYLVVGLIDKAKLYVSSTSYYTGYVLLNNAAIKEMRDQIYLQYAQIANFVGTYDNGTKSTEVIDSYKYSAFIHLKTDLGPNEVVESVYRSNNVCGNTTGCSVDGTMTFTDSYQSTVMDNVSLTYTDAFDSYYDVYVSQDIYDKIFYENIYQVSVLTNTDIDVKGLYRTILNISSTSGGEKYDAIYPYDSKSASSFEALTLLLMNVGMIGLIVVVLVGSTLITYVIFRAIINTKLHDYAIFRTIGANRSMIKYFIYLENIYIVLVAYAVFVLGTLLLPNTITINSGILYSLKVFNLPRYLIFFFLEIIMSLIISSRYCNRIFKDTVNKTLKTNLG